MLTTKQQNILRILKLQQDYLAIPAANQAFAEKKLYLDILELHENHADAELKAASITARANVANIDDSSEFTTALESFNRNAKSALSEAKTLVDKATAFLQIKQREAEIARILTLNEKYQKAIANHTSTDTPKDVLEKQFYCDILKVSADPGRTELNAALKKARITVHPDKVEDPSQKADAEIAFKFVETAVAFLSQPQYNKMAQQYTKDSFELDTKVKDPESGLTKKELFELEVAKFVEMVEASGFFNGSSVIFNGGTYTNTQQFADELCWTAHHYTTTQPSHNRLSLSETLLFLLLSSQRGDEEDKASYIPPFTPHIRTRDDAEVLNAGMKNGYPMSGLEIWKAKFAQDAIFAPARDKVLKQGKQVFIDPEFGETDEDFERRKNTVKNTLSNNLKDDQRRLSYLYHIAVTDILKILEDIHRLWVAPLEQRVVNGPTNSTTQYYNQAKKTVYFYDHDPILKAGQELIKAYIEKLCQDMKTDLGWEKNRKALEQSKTVLMNQLFELNTTHTVSVPESPSITITLQQQSQQEAAQLAATQKEEEEKKAAAKKTADDKIWALPNNTSTTSASAATDQQPSVADAPATTQPTATALQADMTEAEALAYLESIVAQAEEIWDKEIDEKITLLQADEIKGDTIATTKIKQLNIIKNETATVKQAHRETWERNKQSLTNPEIRATTQDAFVSAMINLKTHYEQEKAFGEVRNTVLYIVKEIGWGLKKLLFRAAEAVIAVPAALPMIATAAVDSVMFIASCVSSVKSTSLTTSYMAACAKTNNSISRSIDIAGETDTKGRLMQATDNLETLKAKPAPGA